MDYALALPGAAILIIEAATTQGQTLHRSDLTFAEVDQPVRVAGDEDVGQRLIVRVRERVACRYRCDLTITRTEPELPTMSAHPIEELPGEALRYLLPSRFCEAERFQPFMLRRFDHLAGGPRWPRSGTGSSPMSSTSPAQAMAAPPPPTPFWTARGSVAITRI